jgi:hypothetical protein
MKKTLSALFIMGSILMPAFSLVQAKSISSYGPMAKCKDGTYSYSQNHRGTCSHHGGVRVWYR